MLQLLIVDNSKWTREHLYKATNWTSLGMEVVAACFGATKACEILANKSIDILLIGTEVADMEPIEFAQYVHNHYPKTKVILMSTYKELPLLTPNHTYAPHNANTPNKKIVSLAKSYIEQHLFEKSLNLKQASVDLHINYYYLSKSFKEGAGVSFTEYVNTKRLQVAADLLASTKLHIYQICEQIGMEPKNFHGLFRKYFGMTPQEYRRSHLHPQN